MNPAAQWGDEFLHSLNANMIEFKAECGHTVRAKDEDAGKVVRCSYCGREMQVPDQLEGDGLDFLFSEVEKTGVHEVPSERDRRRRMRKRPKQESAPVVRRSAADAFSIVLKLCYAGIILCVLIWVGKVLHHRIFPEPVPTPIPDRSPPQPPVHTDKLGLIDPVLPPDKPGIIVISVPPELDVYVVKAGAVQGPILREVQKGRGDCLGGKTGQAIECAAGEYDAYVIVKVTDRGLMRLPRYKEEVRPQFTEKGDDVLREYFAPDGSVDTYTETLPNSPTMIIRKYRCVVVERRWTGLTALFVPRTGLDRLVRWLPETVRYRFDGQEVDGELEVAGVARSDWPWITEILKRVGMAICQPKADPGRNLAFCIEPNDGAVVWWDANVRGGRTGPGGR